MNFLIEKCYFHLISQLIYPRYVALSILLNNLTYEVQVDFSVYLDYYLILKPLLTTINGRLLN